MKKTSIFLLALMMTMSAMATPVTFSFASANDTTQSSGGVKLEIRKAKGQSAPAWNDNSSHLRVYASNTLTVSASGITKVEITCTKARDDRAYAALTAGNGTLTSGGESTSTTDEKTDVWTGDVDKVIFTVGTGQRAIKSIVVTLGGQGGGGGGGSQYSFDFTKDQQNWTITDVDLPTGVTFVWKQNSTYGMMGSAYNKQAYAAESWLISPSIDLTGFTSATLQVNQAINQGASTNLKVKISTDGGSTWTDLPLNLPAGTSWTFQTDQVSLDAYVGGTIKIAFVYISTTVCPTWEIKTVNIIGGSTALQTVEAGKVATGKYLIGDQLYIQKSGLLFNAQGQVIK